MMHNLYRNERNGCELFVTCSGQCDRNERNTPLGGVTVVTLARRGSPPVELSHDWTATPPRRERQGAIKPSRPVRTETGSQVAFHQNKDARSC